MDQYQSEKYGINIDQGDIINENANNDNANIQQNINNNHKTSVLPPKKNRSMQYYKFLFYSMKLEVKNTELINLIKYSNSSEVLLYVFSVLVVAGFNTVFIILHSLHLIRGFLGLFVLLKMPQSYNVIQGMESEKNKDDMENKIFNDYARKIINVEIFEKAKPLKNLTFAYLFITMLNIFIDLIDFLNSLAKFNSEYENPTEKITLFVNFIIAILYIGIDFAYIFWFQTLKYTFPQKYMNPINDAFSGLYNRAKLIFKIGKRETDLNTEEILNNQSRPSINNANQPRDVEMNPINNKNINITPNNAQNFNNNNANYPNPNNSSENQENSINYPKLDNNKDKKGYEENLD